MKASSCAAKRVFVHGYFSAWNAHNGLFRKLIIPIGVFPVVFALYLVINPFVATGSDFKNVSWSADRIRCSSVLNRQKFANDLFRTSTLNEEFWMGSEVVFDVVANRNLGRKLTWTIIRAPQEMAGDYGATIRAFRFTQELSFIEKCPFLLHSKYCKCADSSFLARYGEEEIRVSAFYFGNMLIQDVADDPFCAMKSVLDLTFCVQSCSNIWAKHQIEQPTGNPIEFSTFFELTHVIARDLHLLGFPEHQHFTVTPNGDLAGSSDNDKLGGISIGSYDDYPEEEGYIYDPSPMWTRAVRVHLRDARRFMHPTSIAQKFTER